MNENTLKRLQSNPHYKMNAGQKSELASIEKKPMVEFGEIHPHSNDFQIHDTNQSKIRRTSKKSAIKE